MDEVPIGAEAINGACDGQQRRGACEARQGQAAEAAGAAR
jgi:hypothetical protein